MEKHFFAQAAKFLQERKRYKRWLAIFLSLAVVVALGTAAALKLNGRAMTRTQKILDCQLAVHTHMPECYDEENQLICDYADYTVHLHNDDCYGEDGALVCILPEIEAHIHTDECYAEQDVLVCEQEESEGHIHTDECYTTEQGELMCSIQEHTHENACYGEDGVLTCALEEHLHTPECYGTEQTLLCEQEEGEDAHQHTDECFEKERILACGMTELHTHAETCNNEEGQRVCGLIQLEEHTHGEECFEIIEAVVADVQSTEVEELTGTEELVEADGANETEEAIVKTFESDAYRITASYYQKANIPENAALIAEQITAESDKAHYEEREAKYKETLADENASMKALFKIGFYVDGEEIEPEDPVTITVQLLDQDGLPDGAPITVVHFAEEGEEILDGGQVENGSTSFQMNSFSEIAIGVGTDPNAPADAVEPKAEPETESEAQPKPQHIDLDEVYEYKDNAYQVTFHVKGRVKFPEQENITDADGETSSAPIEEEAVDEETDEEASVQGTESGMQENVDGAEAAEQDTENKMEAPQAPSEEKMADELTDSPEQNENEEEPKEANTADPAVQTENMQDSSDESAKTGEIDPNQSGGNADEQPDVKDALDFQMKPLDRASEEYEAVMDYAEELDGVNVSQMMQTISYSLHYQDIELDLSECKITAEIAPGETVMEHLKGSSDSQENQAVTVAAVEVLEDAQVHELDSMVLTEEASKQSMTVALKSNYLAVYGMEMLNPEFTVQYYANMNIMATSKTTTQEPSKDTVKIPLIDTSNQGDGTVGKLPNNALNLTTMYIYAKTEGNIHYADGVNWSIDVPIYQKQLLEMYTEEKFRFVNYPALDNVNKFRERKSKYDISAVWVLKKGKNPDSIDENDWNIYENPENIKFTNNQAAADEETIWVQDDTVIRLVSSPSTGGFNSDAAFYDYDITDGEVYADEKLTQIGDRNSNGTLYVNVKSQGINNPDNYQGYQSGSRYGFGNGNTGGTGLHEDKLGGFNVNQANTSTVYGGCSFGLVEKTLSADGYPQIKVAAPDLFRNTSQIGKTAIPGFSLSFDRDGDTHTLTSVNGSDVKDLDKLYGGKSWSGLSKWTNQFWPMDASSETFGTPDHDLKFGKLEGNDKRKSVGTVSTVNLPESDDHINHHNSYFGMSFSIDFELTQDYIGPLNYYFFGDDDMWVYLDGHLVCDIGGVHTSAGEYVDLWDWIPKEGEGANANGIKKAGSHTLKFFYTERGASGSTCWMQYTLPSVSSVPVDYFDKDYKHTLTVNKKVEGEVQPDEEFEFTIHLKDKDGKPLINYYAYKIMDQDKAAVSSGSIKDGDSFYLKKDYAIVIRNLPNGAQYTITEAENRNFETSTQIGNQQGQGSEASGDIDWDRDDEVTYINKAVPFELPETGGIGTILYTIAGVFGVLCGAGFLYRKKFRERRV